MENNKDNFYKDNAGNPNPEEENMNNASAEVSEDNQPAGGENSEEQESEDEVETLKKKVSELEDKVENEKKEYLFLMADFDNFRKRTLKEKSELIQNGGEKVLKGILPVMDDFERAIKASETSEDTSAMKEGLSLIYQKLQKFLQQNGVKEMDPSDDAFDTEKHEAISVVPVPDEEKKGKILDTVEKGYTINDKVLRHAKVVVAQ